MRQVQTEKRPNRLRIMDRRAFPRKIRQAQQTLGAFRAGLCLGNQQPESGIAQIARKMVALERGEAVAGVVNPGRGY